MDSNSYVRAFLQEVDRLYELGLLPDRHSVEWLWAALALYERRLSMVGQWSTQHRQSIEKYLIQRFPGLLGNTARHPDVFDE